MAILKIKDANGVWQNVHSIKGDKGERGERGPEGPQGPAGGVVSVNGVTPDASGNVSVQVGNDYTLPQATRSTLGGVKIGNNITVSGGTISLTSANVTNALGYTPAQNVPTVTLSSLGVNATAAELNYVDGVTSNIQTQLNNKLSTSGGTMTGSIAFGTTKGHGVSWGTIGSKTPYIGYCTSSGDGTFVVGSLLGTTYQTGLALGGTSGNLLWKGAKVLNTDNISEVALSKTDAANLIVSSKTQPTSSVTEIWIDESSTPTGDSTKVNVSGYRGVLAGYGAPAASSTAISISGTSPDDTTLATAATVNVPNGSSGQVWTKSVAILNGSSTVVLGTAWKWNGGEVPTLSDKCILVLKWFDTFGIAHLITSA